MGAVRRLAFVAVALAAAAACTSFNAVTAPPASEPDAAASDAGAEIGDAIRPDAADGPMACVDAGFVSIDASLGVVTDLETFIPITFGTDASLGYPAVVPDAGTALLAEGEQSARSSIWFATPVPLSAFDIRFEVLVSCTVPSSCADGLAFVWLDASSVDAAFAGGADQGSSFGIPWHIGGAAVAADLFQNAPPLTPQMNDPPAPALEILAIDASVLPTQYPWVVTGAPYPALTTRAWTEIAISVRGAHVGVTVGATHIDANVAPLARGIFGITTATGTSTAGVNVRHLRGSFWSCPPP